MRGWLLVPLLLAVAELGGVYAGPFEPECPDCINLMEDFYATNKKAKMSFLDYCAEFEGKVKAIIAEMLADPLKTAFSSIKAPLEELKDTKKMMAKVRTWFSYARMRRAVWFGLWRALTREVHGSRRTSPQRAALQ